MSKDHRTPVTPGMKAVVTLLSLALTGGWLYLANLGCLAEQLLDGGQIVLEPHRVELVPNTAKTSRAHVEWESSDWLGANWSLDGAGIQGVVSATLQPAAGPETTITITGGDYDSIYNADRFSFLSSSASDVRVTARFAQPFLSAIAASDVPVTRHRYLSVEAVSPHLEFTIPAFQPIVRAESGLLNGLSSVRSLILGVKAEIKNAPVDWRYDFKFHLRIEALWDGGQRTPVFMVNAAPTLVDSSGKWATLRFNDLSLGMDDLFNNANWGFNAKFGHYFIYLDVDVEQTTGGQRTFSGSEFTKYPFYIGHLNLP